VAIKIPIISEFNPKGIAAAQKEFESLTKTTDKTAFALKKMVLPAAAAFGAIVVGGYKAAQSASDLNETINKTNVIFGDASKEIQAFSQTAARELGMAKQEALDFAASFGGLGKMAGKTGDDLANFSTDLVTLTADMASFNNANPAEVALALGAALRGESEPIRRFNVLINDAAVKAEAMAMGLYSGTGNLDQQAKVLATHRLILKQTTDQQGDFNNTIDSAANQQKILTATMKDATTSIGNAFLPILEAVLPLLVSFATFVEKNSGLIVGMSIALGVLAGAIVAANIAMNAWKAISVITAGVNYALAASFTAVQIATGIGIIAVVAGTAAFVAYKKSMESAKAEAESLAGATNNLTGAFVGPQLTAKQLEERMKAFNTQGTGTTKTVESLAKALKEKLGEALDAANDKLDDAKRAFTDFANSVSDGLKDAFSFGDAQDAGKETGKGFIQGLRDQVSGIVDYSKKIQELLDKNLSKDALQQVLASGAEAGMAIADQLIKGGQTAIDETNALVDSANAAAGKVGLNAAGKWFQEGVNTAQKLVDGITGELDKLTPKLMKKMDEIAAKMKRNVNIDVVVTERVNKIISTFGGGIPAMAEGGIVNRPTLALIGEAGPEAVVPLSKMGAGGGDVNINVNGGLATSAEIGQTVLNALRAYQRSAGPLNLNIA
jgi:vacuolar-type H+-ATPase subunit E/Vma4